MHIPKAADGTRVHRSGALEIHMIDELAEELLAAGIEDLPNLIENCEDLRRFEGRRSAWSFPLRQGDSPMRILWRHSYRGGCVRFFTKDLFCGHPRRCLKEFEVSKEARRRGIDTPRVVAALVEDVGWGCYRGDVLLEETQGSTDGLAWLIAHCSASLRKRRRMFREAGRSVARAHSQGLRHPDLNVKNLLITKAETVQILDLDGAKIVEHLPWSERLKCLRRLLRSLRKQEGLSASALASERDLLAFLQGYGGNHGTMRRVLLTLPWKRSYPLLLHLWNGVLCLFAPMIFLWFLWQVHRSKRFAKSWKQLLGLELPPPPKVREKGPVVLVHGASVGEIVAALPLLERLKKHATWLHLTTTTEGGYETAQRKASFDSLSHMPLDFPGRAGRLLDRIDPDILVLMETEFWPGLFCSAQRRGIPIVIANGRLSPSRMKRYERLRSFYKRLLALPVAFFMQSKDDADRLRKLGVCEDSIHVAGNLKLDQIAANLEAPRRKTLASEYRLDDRPLFVAGSTHPGEDFQVIEAWERCRERHPGLRLLLAPRHLDRCDEIERALVSKKHVMIRRSRETSIHHPVAEVILADVMGELAFLYEHGQVCFVGGSLIPIGGHSPLEPAIFGRPVLWGPHMFNFAEAEEMLLKSGGGRIVANVDELVACLDDLFDSQDLRASMGRKAAAAMTYGTGASARMERDISRILKGRKRPCS